MAQGSGDPRGRGRTGGTSPAKLLIGILVVTLVVGGAIVYFGSKFISDKKDEVSQTIKDAFDPNAQNLSDSDRAALGLSGGEQHLWEGGAPTAVLAALDGFAPGTPSQFTELALYTNYAFGTAIDPTQPAKVDMYMWRKGQSDGIQPQPDDPNAAATTFTVTDIDGATIAAAAIEAPRKATTSGLKVNYVRIARSTVDDGSPLRITVYLSGTNGSGSIVFDADGTFVKSF